MRKNRQYRITIALLILLNLLQFAVIVTLRKKPAVPPLKGKIAIVLDDWGYNLKQLQLLKELSAPVTLAVLPNLPYSSRIAQTANELKYEVILHLPMEPRENLRQEQDTITTDMDEAKIISIIDKDLKNLGYAKGVSNHMGSRLTQDNRVMTIILKELKRRGLFFLDSYVTSASVVAGLASRIKIKYARRDIFLDNQEDADYIRRQLAKLKARAGLAQAAVGIGHDRLITLTILKEEIPRMKKEGYRFVFLSELVK